VPTDDERLIGAMSHEYGLLIQSYKEFLYFILANKKAHNDEIKFHLYNSYARVILHLYEFLKACVARDISKTKSEDTEAVKAYIAGEIAKMATRRKLPVDLQKFEDFAEALRKYRNKVSGHVLKEESVRAFLDIGCFPNRNWHRRWRSCHPQDTGGCFYSSNIVESRVFLSPVARIR